MGISTVISAAVALVIAILSGLGIGSGGLFVIWLTSVMGLPPEAARGLNLLFFVFSACGALTVHLRRGRIRAPLALSLSVFAAAGTAIGSLLGRMLSPALLRRLFGAMLVSAGSYTLLSRENKNRVTGMRQNASKKIANTKKPIDL